MNYKEHTVISAILLVVVFAGNVNRYGAEGSCQHPAEAGPQTIWSDLNTAFDMNPAIPEALQVASRYHLRNRATQPFDLTTGPAETDGSQRVAERDDVPEARYLASRYHLRNRTARSIAWSAGSGGENRLSYIAQRKEGSAHSGGTYLANKYHLRDRTTRFFDRARRLA